MSHVFLYNQKLCFEYNPLATTYDRYLYMQFYDVILQLLTEVCGNSGSHQQVKTFIVKWQGFHKICLFNDIVDTFTLSNVDH